MKILHTSDLHIGKQLYEYSLLDDQRHMLAQITALAKQEQVDALLISGDLYDRAVPSAQAVALLDEWLTDLVLTQKITVLAIAGNHDSPQRIAFANRLANQSGLYMVGVPMADISPISIQGVDFYLLPYFYPGDIRLLYPEKNIRTLVDAHQAVLEELTARLRPNTPAVLLAHGFFALAGTDKPPMIGESELAVGGADLLDARAFAPFDYVALGHIHRPQTLSPTIQYAGSPLAYSVSEAGQQKQVLVVEINGNGLQSVTPHPIVPLHPVAAVQASFAQLIDPIFLPPQRREDYLFLNLTDTALVLHAMEKLSTLYPHLLGLRYLPLEGQETTLPALTPREEQPTVQELFTQFFKAVKGEELSPRQQAIMQDIYKQWEEDEPCDQ